MASNLQIGRRTVLKGLGTAIALPLLEAMTPVISLAEPGRRPPMRMAFIYVPNGAHMPEWTPAAEGEHFTLPFVLEPLGPFQRELLVLSGLTLDTARAHGDGGGDHARAIASFLTGRHPKKTGGANIRAGISVDQYAADRVGTRTPFPSLELGCDSRMNSGTCDTGYSCAYSTNLSWRTETTPMAKEINPRLVFERLFADQVKEDAAASIGIRDRHRLSVLDFVLEDARRLKSEISSNDQKKVDEYLNAIRALELRIAKAASHSNKASNHKVTKYDRPAGIPADYQEHIRLMADMIVLAFQADLTRIVTFVLAYDGSNRSYNFIGVPEGHHDLSHHGGSKDKQKKIRLINHFHVSQLAYLLGKLRAVKEGDHTLLDSCMIVYGSGISDGNAHNHENLPVLLAGRGNGTLKTGRHILYPKETPLMNLYLSMLDRMGSPTDSFGDSTGRLPDLA
jgi:hypothetical protein